MRWFPALRCTPYHCPKVGELRRRSTATSNTSPDGHPHQFALGVFHLEMQAAQDAARRPTVVVLHKVEIEPRRAKRLPVPGFHEKTALVAEDPGLQQVHIPQRRFYKLHANTTPSSFSRFLR